MVDAGVLRVFYGNPEHFKRFVITARLLELQLEDWRLYSHQRPDHAKWVCKLARRNAEAGLRHRCSALQLAQRTAQINRLCQRQADMILAGKAEMLDLKPLKGR